MDRGRPLTVAVLGAGLIGVDLVTKIRRSPLLECRLVVARDDQARGLRMAAALGCRTSSKGIDALLDSSEPYDIVFDATNAMSHAEHWALLQPTGTRMIDLTPSMIGTMVAPTVNGAEAGRHANVNLISCGGQAALPVLHRLAREISAEYIEVVTTAASRSVGRATRMNLDEYIETTRAAVTRFTGVADSKVMVNLSPAQPPSPFRVAISLLAPAADPERVSVLVEEAAVAMRRFVPGYRIKVCSVADGVVFVAVEVEATGDRIPHYAGNLDIINAAAVHVAERHPAPLGGRT
ncbi:acetaldehyde dehydrogenase (acetylating) [Embleya hyalina]|uniref:Acetaldehyde dehydrogenase n=1 Tax=Embleya hyalina TaxID=516124 RepID=A0A401Z1N6_9ACTN|nr:acetaldehyde dehydrogenase (acetylating) [Embleya hyalina]GCE00803.1 acetaldehyde dehydrogenase [Embleya hyalina]